MCEKLPRLRFTKLAKGISPFTPLGEPLLTLHFNLQTTVYHPALASPRKPVEVSTGLTSLSLRRLVYVSLSLLCSHVLKSSELYCSSVLFFSCHCVVTRNEVRKGWTLVGNTKQKKVRDCSHPGTYSPLTRTTRQIASLKRDGRRRIKVGRVGHPTWARHGSATVVQTWGATSVL